MLFWSLKLVFLLHSLKFTQRERKKEKKEAMILLQSHSRFLLQTLLNRVHKFVPFLSFIFFFFFFSFLFMLRNSFVYLCLHFLIWLCSLDKAVELDYNWVEFDDVRFHIQVIFTFFFFCCIDFFFYSMKLYLESICFINFYNLFEFLIE